MPHTSDLAHTRSIYDKIFDEERALYGISHTELERVRFAGPADGESALKECSTIALKDCYFELRYPLWHDTNLTLKHIECAPTTRAALWYSHTVLIEQSKLFGPKALRECTDVHIRNSQIESEEFGWMCNELTIRGGSLAGEYAFFHTRNMYIEELSFSGKYSFQYVENLEIEGGFYDTKDAFWHAKNVTVRNATLKGEYLGWYSDGLTLINCHIEGTQPLVNCTNLTLVNCTMDKCDLAFEGSEVHAQIRGHVDSIRDPKSGTIELDSVGELVCDTLHEFGAQIVRTSRSNSR